MRITFSSLELVERDARVAKAGAEDALRAMRAELRAIKRELIASGEHCEDAGMELVAARLVRVVQGVVGRQETEALDAAHRWANSPTERNLQPVVMPANDQSLGKAVAL